MYTWVIYDIRKNRARGRVAKRCQYYGLERVQKSVFLGKLKDKWVLKLHTDLDNMINRRTDKLFVVPMSKNQFKNILQSGKSPRLEDSVAEPVIRII